MLHRLVVLALVPAALMYGWGETGHRTIARLAVARISDPAVKAKILKVLDADSDTTCRQNDLADRLACVSTWADDIKRTSMTFTSNWHFVDIPKGETEYVESRDCKDSPRGDCLIQAVIRERAVLRSVDATAQQRAEAVKFLVHLLGDMTMPLHCVTDGDNGGNGKVATWFGESSNQWGHWNLHSMWDDGLFSRSPVVAAGGAPADVLYTKFLMKSPAGPIVPVSPDRLVSWVLDGHNIGEAVAYGSLPEPKQGSAEGPERTAKMYYTLGEEYLGKTLKVAERQLVVGGDRLASVLVEVFGNGE